MSVGQTILAQLGGNKFCAMTGARSFSSDGKNLTFRIGRNEKKVNAIRITLLPNDTYKMEFLGIRNLNVKTISEVDNVYCDMLQEIFENHTGMYTKL